MNILSTPSTDYGVQLTSAPTKGILSSDDWRTMWVSWRGNIISFGRGPIPHNDTLLKWRADKKIRVQQIGLASAWGSHAEFR